jgi:hypothetical protein
MAEIIQPEGVDMFQMDLEHIHAVLRNRSYDVESLMRRVSAISVSARDRIDRGQIRRTPHSTFPKLQGGRSVP